MRHRFFLVISVACLLVGHDARAQVDTTRPKPAPAVTHILTLRDGSTIIGKLVSRDSVSVRFETNGGLLTVPAANVLDVKEVKTAEMHGDEYWFPDPNRTRLFFAPTGRMLDKGEAYYSNTYLFLQNFVGGVTDNVTMGGGFSVLPGSDFLTNNVYYFTPKVGVYKSPRTNVAVGVLAGFLPADQGHSFGIGYGVVTQGIADASVTGGFGFGYADRNVSKPILMLGGVNRLSRRTAFVTENYAIPGAGYLVSYGLRFMGEKMSTDFALWNSSEAAIFPGIPYISFAVKF